MTFNRWIITICLALIMTSGPVLRAQSSDADLTKEKPMQGKMLESPKLQMRLEGEMGRRIGGMTHNWLLTAPLANPAMIEMFRLRDRTPGFDIPMVWKGEFAGKYLHSATLTLAMTDDPALRQFLKTFVADLISTQAPDGYLGPFRTDQRWVEQWDLWGHYQVMLALYKYYQATGDQAALEAVLKAADLICDTFLDTGRSITALGHFPTNMAIIHIMGILYRETGNERYLGMMQKIEKEWEEPGVNDYHREALKGTEYFELPVPRWEALHTLEGLGELYLVTGQTGYRDALMHYWRSLLENDVHNNGSFSTAEAAIGNPFVMRDTTREFSNPAEAFMNGRIETCCTVAWLALSLDALKLSGNSRVADELERSLWNGALAYMHPSGRWCTYDTPMDGKRESSQQTIVFQSYPGSPELNCCSTNGPRGLAMLSEWAILSNGDNLYLNYYGPGTTTLETADAQRWKIEQQTRYPAEGTIKIVLGLARPDRRVLQLRIPGWSESPVAKVNGEALQDVKPGSYRAIDRTWSDGDVIELDFGMPLHILRGDQNVGQRTSIFLGPLLMAYDQKFNTYDPDQIPALDGKHLDWQPVGETSSGLFEPIQRIKVMGDGNRELVLCDFATAGASGTYYQSWLTIENLPPGTFMLRKPHKAATVSATAPVTFEWTSPGEGVTCDFILARDEAMTDVVVRQNDLSDTRLELALPGGSGIFYWQALAKNSQGVTAGSNGPRTISVEP